MSLEFAIIPITNTFLSAAYTIQSKLKENVKLEMSITIDTNYNTQLSTRINKWKKEGYNVVTIDSDFDESNSIVVRIFGKGTRAQSMEVEEFIDLVASFEDETNNNKLDGSNNDNNSNLDGLNNDNDGCIVM